MNKDIGKYAVFVGDSDEIEQLSDWLDYETAVLFYDTWGDSTATILKKVM